MHVYTCIYIYIYIYTYIYIYIYTHIYLYIRSTRKQGDQTNELKRSAVMQCREERNQRLYFGIQRGVVCSDSLCESEHYNLVP